MREPPGGKRVPCPGVVFLGEAQIGWLWGQTGGRPETRSESLRKVGIAERRPPSRSWLRKRSEIDSCRSPEKVYLKCRNCGHTRPANSYTVRPEVMKRLRCRNCRGRVEPFGMKRSIVNDAEDHRREWNLGAWIETPRQRRDRIRRESRTREG